MAYLEAWLNSGPELVPLDGDRITVGSSESNDLVLDADRTVSRLHALLERIGDHWCIRDVGSRNGTYVNGDRLLGDRALRSGDEVMVGKTRLVMRGEGAAGGLTEAAEPPPEITRREHTVLVELCRPVMSGSMIAGPATVKQIAARLVLTESAVKKHLLRLYDKFGVHGESGAKRGELANEAIRRGAVQLAELREATSDADD